MKNFILTIHCPDKPGIVAAVSTALNNANCNIEHASLFNDELSGQFFIHIIFSPRSTDAEKIFEKDFDELATKFEMTWQIYQAAAKVKTLLMVSKQDHCLHDILYQWKTGHLPIEITGIVSNHKEAKALAETNGLSFHHLPVTKDTKEQQEKQLETIIEKTQTELIVMARYMQVLSNNFCNKYAGRVINIHHSFLPGFKGAKPYHQAYKRGVKIIGATAHFATADLDEGPIIAQEIVPIDHTHTPEKLVLLGRDIEARTLRHAISLYSGRHIFLQDNRTIILQ